MDNGSRFLSLSFLVSAAFQKLIEFLISNDAPADLLSDMIVFKEKFDLYRSDFLSSYLKGVCKSGFNSKS